MANKVKPEDIIKMNELYLKLHTYAAVARETGFSASTVSKYIQKNYTPIEKREIIKFNGSCPDFNPSIFVGVEDYGSLCVLSDAEKEEIKELWKELNL